jgi:hypothetical protein
VLGEQGRGRLLDERPSLGLRQPASAFLDHKLTKRTLI